MIIGHAHTCFTVSNLDQAIAFYVDRLGLSPAFEFRRDDGARYGVYLKIGPRAFIELFQGDLAEKAERQSYAHLCLECDDVLDTVEMLRSRGVEVSEARLGMDRSWQAWVTDPFGNRIELHSYTPESWQAPHLDRAPSAP